MNGHARHFARKEKAWFSIIARLVSDAHLLDYSSSFDFTSVPLLPSPLSQGKQIISPHVFADSPQLKIRRRFSDP